MKFDFSRLFVKLKVKSTTKLFSKRNRIIHYRIIKITGRNFKDWLNIWFSHKRKYIVVNINKVYVL